MAVFKGSGVGNGSLPILVLEASVLADRTLACSVCVEAESKVRLLNCVAGVMGPPPGAVEGAGVAVSCRDEVAPAGFTAG